MQAWPFVETDYLGCDFVDYFSVARIDGRWQITNKTYAYTGGPLELFAQDNETCASKPDRLVRSAKGAGMNFRSGSRLDSQFAELTA